MGVHETMPGSLGGCQSFGGFVTDPASIWLSLVLVICFSPGMVLASVSPLISNMNTLRPAALTLLLLAAGFSSLQAAPDAEKTEPPMTAEQAQAAAEKKIESFGWTRSGKGRLGSVAEIAVPAGYRFTGPSGCKKMLELTHNIPNGGELGVIAPEDLGWWVLFEYEESGYVKDTDKDSLDADAILKDLQKGQASSNEARVQQGLPKLYLDGWAMKPKYNEVTHNLEWAIRVRSERGGISINYLTKLLGRRGVMHVTLLVDPESMDATLPAYQKLLTGFAYLQGQTYAEYRKGDKVAQYALTGLITAGAGVALVKSGWLGSIGLLLAKLGKGIYLLVVAGLAGIKRLFAKLFGKNDSSPQV